MTSSSSTSSPLIGADGVVYVGSDNMYAIYPSGSLKWISLISTNPQTPVLTRQGILLTGSGNTIYSVGAVISTQSPSLLASFGLQPNSPWPKFSGDVRNTVRHIVSLCSSLKSFVGIVPVHGDC
jgi:hypothetical protein